MKEIACGQKMVLVDDEGFLVNQNDWNEEVALAIGRQEGFDSLDAQQLEIIKFLREYYHRHQVFPILNYVCKNLHQPRKCVNEEFVNPMKAWKIAGLPKLDGVHFVSVDGKTFRLEECC